MKMHVITITTDASGNGSKSFPVRGRLLHIQYVKTDYATGVDFTITAATTGRTLWTEANVNASETVSPRTAIAE